MTDAPGTMWPTTEGVFALGDLGVERGEVIRDAHLAYATYGTLSAARDNVVVYPCSYTATHDDLAWLIGPEGVLDPTRWFVVVPDMFSNGLSSSASQMDPHDATAWPEVVTVADNVRAQHRLLTEVFDVQRVVAAYGFSMGAGQAYHWAALYPELVERAIVVCGSARTAVHNQVFLRGLLRILEAAPEHLGGGRFAAEPVAAKRAFAEVYAGWGLSQDFYRAGLYSTALGYADLDEFLQTEWVDDFARSRAADLYAQATTWLHGDISATPESAGDLPATLAAIRAKVLLVPSETDLYFRVADNAAELEHLRAGRLAVIPTIWGHRAGSPQGLADETAFLTRAVREWLDA
jgi:homoserine O-acetyltransferase/O-succinyltransferase